MRVCLLSPYDLSLEGGVNKHVYYLADHLRALGDEVAIIGPASGERPRRDDVTCFGGVVSIQGNESDNRMGVLTSPLAVRRYMRARRFDVLHVHEPFVPMLPYWAVAFCDAPARVATFHRYSEHEDGATRATRRVLSPFLRAFRRGIAVSEPAARYAELAWPRPLAIIPNGVDTRAFTPPAEGTSPSTGRGTSAAPLRLLFVAQWTDRRKGLQVLIDACARLRAQGVAWTLEVVGKGDGSWAPAPLDGVTFHGRVDEVELARRYRACDVFVAPSLGQESFGIVLVEAMASGRAVVCSDIEGYRQVASLEGAKLVAPRDAAGLALALAELAANPTLREQMGRSNLRAARLYEWSVLAPQVRDEYLAALG